VRTINTSGTVLVVLFAIFILGGEVIRGFSFALIVGVAVGVYSTIFIAIPVAYDLLEKEAPKEKETVKETVKEAIKEKRSNYLKKETEKRPDLRKK
jgi:SecD/SecF fusion protein